MMLRLLVWNYQDDNNCWDYVRFCLHSFFSVPNSQLPKFGPVFDRLGDDSLFGMTQKKMEKMTEEAPKVLPYFDPSGPVEGAVACKYYGNYLYHVGIVIGKNVYHVSKSRTGVKVDSIKKFELGAKTQYYLHKSLCK